MGYVVEEQPGWQLDIAVYPTKSGIAKQWRTLSKPGECTPLPIENIRRDLKNVENTFADVDIQAFPRPLCLPPNTKFEITANTMRVESRVAQIDFVINEPFVEMHSSNPFSDAPSEPPLLPNGQFRYATILLGTRLTVTYSRWRAQDRDLAKYQAWIARFTQGLKQRLIEEART